MERARGSGRTFFVRKRADVAKRNATALSSDATDDPLYGQENSPLYEPVVIAPNTHPEHWVA